MMVFSQFLHSDFQAEHIKDTKEAQGGKKGKIFILHAYFWDLMLKDLFCDSYLI